MRLTRKLLLPILIVLLIVFLGLLFVNYIRSVRDLQNNEATQLNLLYEIFGSQVEDREQLALALAVQTSGNEIVRKSFAERDREVLVDQTLGAYLALKSQYDVSQMQFHLPPATSFVRLHQLDQYGDDLSAFRATVVTANAKHRMVSGIEIGRGGLGVRGVVPVSYQAEYIGTVEYGLDIGQDFLKGLKDQYGSDWTLLLSKEPAQIATFQPGNQAVAGPSENLLFQVSTLVEPFFAPQENYQRALAGERSIEHISVGSREYSILSGPVYDYSGQVIGVLDIVSDYTPLVLFLRERMLITMGILVIALVATSLLLTWLTTKTLRPVGVLTITAKEIASGDLNQVAKVESNDEIGDLAVAFNAMTDQLRGMIGTLEQGVADRTRALETSTDVSRRLSTILDQQELVNAVVEEVQKAFDYYHAHIYLLDEAGENLVMAGGTGDAGRQMLASGHKIPTGHGLVGRAAQSGEAVLVTDTTADPNWLPNSLLPETRSEVAVPIMLGEQVLGVLDVQQNIVYGLTQSDVDLLQSIANQVAVAIQNARLYTRLQRQAEHETQINQIGQKIQQTLTIEDTLQVALRELSLVLVSPKASIQLGVHPSDGNGIIKQ